jgi:hypothetical protein
VNPISQIYETSERLLILHIANKSKSALADLTPLQGPHALSRVVSDALVENPPRWGLSAAGLPFLAVASVGKNWQGDLSVRKKPRNHLAITAPLPSHATLPL